MYFQSMNNRINIYVQNQFTYLLILIILQVTTPTVRTHYPFTFTASRNIVIT